MTFHIKSSDLDLELTEEQVELATAELIGIAMKNGKGPAQAMALLVATVGSFASESDDPPGMLAFATTQLAAWFGEAWTKLLQIARRHTSPVDAATYEHHRAAEPDIRDEDDMPGGAL